MEITYSYEFLYAVQCTDHISGLSDGADGEFNDDLDDMVGISVSKNYFLFRSFHRVIMIFCGG